MTKFKVGDLAAVGCIVDSCLECNQCKDGDENYCKDDCTEQYMCDREFGRVPGNEELQTYGGYSTETVVHEHFVLRVPEGIPHEKVAPILCAGVTVYDPLKHWGANGEKKLNVGIIGIGGLGTMAIKVARAMGNNVYAVSTNPKKEELVY